MSNLDELIKKLEDAKEVLQKRANEADIESGLIKYSSNGQWSLDKSNYGPKDMKLYDPNVNQERKANNVGETVPDAGKNVNVKAWTTMGSAMSQAHNKAEAKKQKAKTKASTRTLADMSDEEKAAMKAKYEKPLAKGADVVREALTTGQLPVMGDTASQPTDAQMFGHLVVSPEALKKAEERYQGGNKDVAAELSKPVDKLNKSTVQADWSYSKSFNSLLKEQLSEKEMAERNSYIGE